MEKMIDVPQRVARPVQNIRFYQDVVALFTLSRKLKKAIPTAGPTMNKARKTILLTHFSERLVQLPMAIAEAEVTKDELKRIAIHLDVKSLIPELLTYWTQIKVQLCLPSDWTQKGDAMTKRLLKNYESWTRSLTSAN